MKKRIIIDCDMGADDYIAIQLAILSNKFNVEGISLVNGNTSLKQATSNVFKTLDMINYLNKIKVYKGCNEPLKIIAHDTDDFAHGNNGFSNVEYKKIMGHAENVNAIDWMIKLVNENPNKITIVATGPLTNIASAILKDKNFASNIKELVVMLGAEKKGNITPFAEFNSYKDPYAAKIVFEAGIKNLTMIGFDITSQVTINKPLEQLLKKAHNINANFIYAITRSSANIDINKNKLDGATINDAINICYLLNKNVLKLKKCHVKIENEAKENLGESIIDYHLPSNAKIAKKINAKACKKIIFNTLFPKLKKELKKII